MNITSTKVVPGCISCKNCESICPEIFKVDPQSQVISDKFNQNAIKLLMAEKMCPVNVIKVEKQGDYSLDAPQVFLESKTYLTPDTIELIFSCENFTFTPGQYVSLQMKDIRGEFSRSYSIASATQTSFTLTVKLLKKGRGSSYLRKLGERTLKSGFLKNDKIEFIGALGDFQLQNTQVKKVMVATGTGLAPMIAMLESLPDNVEKLLVFGVRFEADLFYLDKLKTFKNLELRTCVSRLEKNCNKDVGRVTDYIHDISPEDEVYICGNPDMVREVRKTLKERGHNKKKIFHEDFTLAAKPEPLWKNIVFEGNLPGTDALNIFCIYLGAIAIPIFYFFASYYNWLGVSIFGKDIYSILFALSWHAVVFVMIIRPLADIFPKLTVFRRLVVLRKGLGIVSASIIVSILVAKWVQNPFTFTAFFTTTAWSLWYGLFARLSEVTAVVLLATSNRFSQKVLGVWWKRIQKTSYIYFVTGGILAAQWSQSPYAYYVIIGLVGMLWILAYFRIGFGK